MAPLALAPLSAQAVPVVATDFDSINPGTLVASLSDTFSNGLGTVYSSVWYDSTTDVYTYAYMQTAGTNGISEFNTAFDFLGFNGVAGWNIAGDETSANASGAGSTLGFLAFGACGQPNPGVGGYDCDIRVDHDPDGTIDWNGIYPHTLDVGEDIVYFAQSVYAWTTDSCNTINSHVGSAACLAPMPQNVPEPGTMLLVGAGLLGLGAARRKAAHS